MECSIHIVGNGVPAVDQQFSMPGCLGTKYRIDPALSGGLRVLIARDIENYEVLKIIMPGIDSVVLDNP